MFCRDKISTWKIPVGVIFIFKKNFNLDSSSELGPVTICSRYAYSGAAYSHAKGLDMEWCKVLDRGLPEPDVIFFLDIPPEVAFLREGYGGEVFEKLDFQQKVKLSFDQLLAEETKCKVINAEQEVEEIAKPIQDTFNKVVEQILGNKLLVIQVYVFEVKPLISKHNKMHGELLDVCDEDGANTGNIEPRSKVHDLGLWHRVVCVWILKTSTGRLLLQRRSNKVSSHCGKWICSASGHVAHGESLKRAAVREIEEELGLKIDEEESDEPIDSFKNVHLNDKEFITEYLLFRELVVQANPSLRYRHLLQQCTCWSEYHQHLGKHQELCFSLSICH